GLAGVETSSINSGVPLPSAPTRFFDLAAVSYYLTDNFEVYAGHAYTFGTHFLALGGEYGFALGGGRMASLFADGWIGEGGEDGALVGPRIYFGRRYEALMDRQGPPNWEIGPGAPWDHPGCGAGHSHPLCGAPHEGRLSPP